nr:hypothetical protein DA06_17900 [Georgenia sp. SUBG003]
MKLEAAVIVADVLCFTTCVSIAVGRGTAVHPARGRDGRAAELATRVGAELAVPRDEVAAERPYSLSPAQLLMARPTPSAGGPPRSGGRGGGSRRPGLRPTLSPEADAARAVLRSVDVGAALRTCASGVELADRGWAADVETAAERDADTAVPLLADGAFLDRSDGS